MSATTIQSRFERFHEANPHVLDRLENLAESWFDRGNEKVAIRMLWEVLRWSDGLEVNRGSDTYKLNDHYPSRYARLLVERRPEWAGRFRVRELRAA